MQVFFKIRLFCLLPPHFVESPANRIVKDDSNQAKYRNVVKITKSYYYKDKQGAVTKRVRVEVERSIVAARPRRRVAFLFSSGSQGGGNKDVTQDLQNFEVEPEAGSFSLLG